MPKPGKDMIVIRSAARRERQPIGVGSNFESALFRPSKGRAHILTERQVALKQMAQDCDQVAFR